jgi:hypothetical protein
MSRKINLAETTVRKRKHFHVTMTKNTLRMLENKTIQRKITYAF